MFVVVVVVIDQLGCIDSEGPGVGRAARAFEPTVSVSTVCNSLQNQSTGPEGIRHTNVQYNTTLGTGRAHRAACGHLPPSPLLS